MNRQRILNALLIASFGAMAATGAAQNHANHAGTGQCTEECPAGDDCGTPDRRHHRQQLWRNDGAQRLDHKAPATADSSAPTSMSGYKAARAACDKQPLKDQCRKDLNARYSAVSPQCQKLSGAALDDCLKGADTGQ